MTAPEGPRTVTPAQLALMVGVGALTLYVTLGYLILRANLAVGMWLVEFLIFFGVAFAALRATGAHAARYPRLRNPGWMPLAFAALLGVANFFAVLPVQYLAQKVSPEWLNEMVDQTRIFEGKTLLEMVAIIGAVSVAAPFCEEYCFRGVIQRGLMPPLLSPRGALVFGAMVFSAFHLDPVGFAARVELGLLFGFLFWRCDSLWPAVIAHSANNLISTIVYLGTGGREDEADPTAVATAGAFGLGVMILLWRWARTHPALWGRPATRAHVQSDEA
jgi:membrane protease YdiL (CAAX protease family)